jgi:uncharacterized membrane protein YeiH
MHRLLAFITGVFGSVVADVFKNIFCSKIYQTIIILLFLKIIFNINISKQFENIKKNSKTLLKYKNKLFLCEPYCHG